MADSKLRNLTAATTAAIGDLFYVVRDPSGTPVDRKITVGDLLPVLMGWYNVKNYGAVGDGSTDDTTAIKAAIDDVVTNRGGGTLYFPSGVYVVGGALQDTGGGGANAQIPFTQIDGANPSTTAQKSLVIQGSGPGPTSGESSLVPTGQSIIKSTLGTGSGTLPAVFASKAGLRNNLHVAIRDMVFQCPSNPPLTCLNLGDQQDVIITDVLIHTGSMAIASVGQPTHTTYGIVLPRVNNATLSKIDGVMVWGFSRGYYFGELVSAGSINAEACLVGLEIGPAFHGSHIAKLGCFECAKAILASGTSVLLIDFFDIENANGTTVSWQDRVYHIDDASNLIHGRYTWHQVDAGSGVPTGGGYGGALTNNGGTNFTGTRATA